MKSKKQFIVTVVFTALSVLISLAFCGFRIGFIFVDHETFDSLSYLLWAVFIINSLFMLAHLRSQITKDKNLGKPLFIVNCALTALSIVCAVAFCIVGKDDILNFYYVSFELLPVLATVYGLIFFIAIFPHCGEIFKKCVAVIAALAVVISALAYLFPVGGFKFESAPAVFNTGDSYHVIFATSQKSVGYIAYSYDGTDYKVWDTTTGRKDSSTVHSIEVPFEHLDNNAYSVGAVKATEDIAYGGHQGREITYDVEKFTPCPEDNFDMTVVTDNHSTRVDWTNVGKDADIFVFLGDIANGIYTYGSFIDNLIVPAGDATGGGIPVIYARGNHDHRGSIVRDMLRELDFDEYYYRVNIGEYVFTVLDTGEDKDDDNYEYGGYNDYVSYYDKQTEWARSLKTEAGYNIVIAHDSGFFHASEGHEQPIADILKDLGVGFSISGHSHMTKFVSAKDSKTGISYYISGHFSTKKDLYYTNIHFNAGHMDIVSVNTAGDEINTAEFQVGAVILD